MLKNQWKTPKIQAPPEIFSGYTPSDNKTLNMKMSVL